MKNKQASLRKILVRYLAVFAAIALPIVLVIGLQLSTERDTAVTYGRSHARNVASALEAKLEAEFRAAVVAVSRIAEASNPVTLNESAVPQHRASINPWLKSLVPYLSTASAIRVFQADGRLLYSSLDTEVNSNLNIRDRDFFQKAMQARSDAALFSEVVVGRLSKRVTMYVVKPIRDREGVFIGLAMAAIDLNALHDFFKEISLGVDSILALRRLDNGAAVVRYPGPVEVDNEPFPNLPNRLALLQGSKEVVLDFISPVDGVHRIHASRQVGDYPLYVVVGLAEQDYLADWYQHRRLLVLATSVMLVLLGSVLYLLALSQWRRELSEQALAESYELLESKVAARTLELREALSRFDSFMSIVPSAIAIIDFDGKAQYFNPGFKELFGYVIEEMPDIEQWWSKSYPDENYRQTIRQSWDAAIQQSLTDGSPIKDFEAQVCTRSGDFIWIAAYAHVAEKTIYIAMVDITTRKRQQEKIISLNASLERRASDAEAANQAKSAFLANMSHEIRTPMNGILGMVHVLRRTALSPEQQQKLNVIESSGKHLLAIISDILDLSKIDAGKTRLDIKHFDLLAVLESALEMVRIGAQEKHLALNLEAANVPAMLYGDSVRLMQALVNYLGNALKFTDRGSITLAVGIVEESDTGYLMRFEVRDTGIGIAKPQQAKLFHVFEQADNSSTRAYGGTGLGLAITQRIAHLMGGEVGLSSAEGQGSIFWLTAYFRKLEQVAEAPPATLAGDIEQHLRTDCAGKRVLMAEDEPINQEITQGLLADVGLLVDTANNGAEALHMAEAHAYDLILMDMQMPVMHGIDATRAIRALDGYAAVPIVAMTANAFTEDRDRCLAAGMNDFVTKPTEPEILFKTVYRWLVSSRA